MGVQNQASIIIENKILKGPELLFDPQNLSLGAKILDILKENSEFVGQIDGRTGETCTYGKLADMSIRCALWLKKQNISRGDIVSIYSDNTIVSWAPFLAVLYIGASVSVWCNEMPSDATRGYVNLVKPKILFTNGEGAKEIKNMLEEENIDSRIVVCDKLPGFESFDDIIGQQTSEDIAKFQCSFVKSEDDAALCFSSGSTGIPKGILFSYEGLHQALLHDIVDMEREKNGMIRLWSSSSSWFVGLICLLSSILTISPAVIVNKSSIEELCKIIEKYKVEWMFASSIVCNNLGNSEELTKYNLSSLNIISTGGGKIWGSCLERINLILPNSKIFHCYGASESCGVATINTKDHNNWNSCGKPFCNTEIKIVNINTGESLEPNKTGEICIKRRVMMKGYYRNPKATQEVIDSEGWYHTGDLGYYDEECNMFFVDRMKDTIKYKNDIVFPLEIEEVLLKHPGVKVAAVVGRPNSQDGEHPIAFVIKDNLSKVTEEELINLSSSLGESKILRGGVIFLEKMPQTMTQKLGRLELKKIASNLLPK